MNNLLRQPPPGVINSPHGIKTCPVPADDNPFSGDTEPRDHGLCRSQCKPKRGDESQQKPSKCVCDPPRSCEGNRVQEQSCDQGTPHRIEQRKREELEHQHHRICGAAGLATAREILKAAGGTVAVRIAVFSGNMFVDVVSQRQRRTLAKNEVDGELDSEL